MKRSVRVKNLFFGFFLICIAAVMILDKLDMLGGISWFKGAMAVICGYFLIRGIVKMEFFNISLSIAVLIILFDEQLKLEAITPWPVLGAALLVGIGLSMIFKKKHHINVTVNGETFKKEVHKDMFNDTVIDQDDADEIRYETVFSSSIKYINSENFRRANLECNFGSMQVFFDNARIQGDHATINVECNFGKMELIFPKEWNVIVDLDAPFAGVSEQKKYQSANGPTVHLQGDSAFGKVEIRYA